MKQSDALKRLNEFDQKGRYVYAARDLAKLLDDKTTRSREATIKRLVDAGILERPTKGVYVYGLSRNKGPNTVELVAKTLRRGEYNYLSLESCLSEYGVISQIPVDRITVMTTGRKGEYRTPYGTIEFTHTSRPISEIKESVQDIGRPLRVATLKAALRDQKRVGRNTHLINYEEVEADEG